MSEIFVKLPSDLYLFGAAAEISFLELFAMFTLAYFVPGNGLFFAGEN